MRLLSCTSEIIPIDCLKLKVIDVVSLADDSHIFPKLVTFMMYNVCRLKVEKLVLRSVVIREAVCKG